MYGTLCDDPPTRRNGRPDRRLRRSAASHAGGVARSWPSGARLPVRTGLDQRSKKKEKKMLIHNLQG
jgi:hypothetical protein